MNPDESTPEFEAREDESSLEFDKYEAMRLALLRVLLEEGRDPVEAERISFYVLQGVREVPRLLAALSDPSASDAKIRRQLHAALANAAALARARTMLVGSDGAASENALLE